MSKFIYCTYASSSPKEGSIVRINIGHIASYEEAKDSTTLIMSSGVERYHVFQSIVSIEAMILEANKND